MESSEEEDDDLPALVGDEPIGSANSPPPSNGAAPPHTERRDSGPYLGPPDFAGLMNIDPATREAMLAALLPSMMEGPSEDDFLYPLSDEYDEDEDDEDEWDDEDDEEDEYDLPALIPANNDSVLRNTAPTIATHGVVDLDGDEDPLPPLIPVQDSPSGSPILAPVENSTDNEDDEPPPLIPVRAHTPTSTSALPSTTPAAGTAADEGEASRGGPPAPASGEPLQRASAMSRFLQAAAGMRRIR